MLGRRLFSAAVIISIMLLLIWGDFYLGRADGVGHPGLILCSLGMVIAALAAGELISMWKSESLNLNVTVGVVCAVVMVAVFSVRVVLSAVPADCPVGTFGWVTLGLSTAVGLVFVFEMFSFRGIQDADESQTVPSGEKVVQQTSQQGEIAARLGHYVLCFGYLTMLFGFLVPHRMLIGPDGDCNKMGLIALITLIATVKMSDSFAYFTGKSLGKHKLVPTLSPGKTIEGAVGAIFGGWFATAIVVFVVAPFVFGITIGKPWWWFLLYGTLVTAFGMIGDLAESLLKRDSKTKDSSKWLPGLGGVLDVIDSLVFAAPISFFLWI